MSEKITLADQIYADIKKDITNKQLVSGEKINIKELARKYGVSDTPVKQALQRLAEEKLVVNTPNKGMSVRTLTPHELNDTFDIRLMMDTFFIKDIITTLNYNSTLRQQLLENMEKQKQFIACNDSTMDAEGYFQLDLEFHMLYLTASGNQKAVEVLKDLQPFTFPPVHTSISPIIGTANVWKSIRQFWMQPLLLIRKDCAKPLKPTSPIPAEHSN